MMDSAAAHRSDGPFDATLASGTASPRERSGLAAITVGALFGAVAFALVVLWLGPVAGLAVALASTLHALWRRRAWAAIAFVVAGALAATAARSSGSFALLAGLVYALALAVGAQRSRRDELLA